MSKHLETAMERVERLATELNFIRGSMTIESNQDKIEYSDDTVFGITYEDLIFLTSKAGQTLLLEEENRTLRYRMSDGYAKHNAEYIKFLEAENRMLKREIEKLRKNKRD
jgi:hypothetical protein